MMKKLNKFLGVCLLLPAIFSLAGFPAISQAEENSFKMTVTPPLIKNNLNKGETWASSIKVINNNKEAIKIYTQVLDFKSREDGAGPEFIQKDGDKSDWKFMLSNWLEVEAGPIAIQPQESREIPFVIKVPEDATPGGHYAAILAGTQPEGETEGTAIKVSSLMASLIMVVVRGEMVEDCAVREFSAGKTIFKTPTVDFTVKLENQGNVHIQPVGEIGIYDMFGQEKGKLALNQKSEFGNIMPDSARKWTFNWQGEKGLLKMGRYRADLVLSYGNENKETLASGLYFWYLDYQLLGIVLGVIFFIILLIYFLIKRSIRKAVLATSRELQNNLAKGEAEEGISTEANKQAETEEIVREEVRPAKRIAPRPRKSQTIDLKKAVKQKEK